MEPFKVLSLFAGIGGFDLGLERAGGFKTVAFCEIDPFCQRVLAKHWPGVPIYDDVRTLTAEQVGPVDCIVGGFPCQDLSFAGKGAGLAGERSGLWSEYARLVGEFRPSYVIVENVAALLSRGLGTVLGDLASLGYDAEWHCIPAAYVGAPHRRDRLWIVAYPNCHHDTAGLDGGANRATASRGEGGCAREGQAPHRQWVRNEPGAGRQTLAHSGFVDVEGLFPGVAGSEDRQESGKRPPGSRSNGFGWWAVEPDVGRVAHGVPARVDRLRCLGNAVVPQIPELIGRAILEALSSERQAA